MGAAVGVAQDPDADPHAQGNTKAHALEQTVRREVDHAIRLEVARFAAARPQSLPPGSSDLPQLRPQHRTQSQGCVGMKRPMSVKNLAIEHLLTRHVAWSEEEHEAPMGRKRALTPAGAAQSAPDVRTPAAAIGKPSQGRHDSARVKWEHAEEEEEEEEEDVIVVVEEAEVRRAAAAEAKANPLPARSSPPRALPKRSSRLIKPKGLTLNLSPQLEEDFTPPDDPRTSAPVWNKAEQGQEQPPGGAATLSFSTPSLDTLGSESPDDRAVGGPKLAPVGVSAPRLTVDMSRTAPKYQDEADWIQVEDGDPLEDSVVSPRQQRAPLSVNIGAAATEESYMFTQSGAIKVAGVDDAIRETGLSRAGHLPMRDRVVRLEKLGQGATGSVYKGLDLLSLELVAVKVIPIFDRAKRRQMVHELTALYQSLVASASQPTLSADDEAAGSGRAHIVAFLDAFSNVEDATVSLMVEYMNGGSLQNLVDGGGCEDEATLATIARQSLRGLLYLHSSNHLHRDVKPANMLINHQGEVKVSDFGIIRRLESKAIDDNGMLDPGAASAADGRNTPLASAHTFVGTVTYMSPERINGESYSTPSDVWSLGLSVMTCALGKTPVDSRQGYWTLLKCVRDDPPPQLPEDGPWSAEFRDFVHRCLRKDPADRATCAELLQHPFVTQAPRDAHDGAAEDADARALLQQRATAELRALLHATHRHLAALKRENRALPGVVPRAGPSLADAVDNVFAARSLERLSQQLDLPEAAVRRIIDDHVREWRAQERSPTPEHATQLAPRITGSG